MTKETSPNDVPAMKQVLFDLKAILPNIRVLKVGGDGDFYVFRLRKTITRNVNLVLSKELLSDLESGRSPDRRLELQQKIRIVCDELK
jgi:hypothetical protein